MIRTGYSVTGSLDGTTCRCWVCGFGGLTVVVAIVCDYLTQRTVER